MVFSFEIKFIIERIKDESSPIIPFNVKLNIKNHIRQYIRLICPSLKMFNKKTKPNNLISNLSSKENTLKSNALIRYKKELEKTSGCK